MQNLFPRWLAVLLVNLSAFAAEIGPDANPGLGTAKVSEAEEQHLGQMCQTLWTFSQATLCDDNPIVLKTQALLDALTACSDRPRLSYQIKGAPEKVWDDLWNYVPYARCRSNRATGSLD